MKITIFFPLFFLILTGLFGQDYKPMLTDNSEWHEYFTPGPWCNATLRIDGDSIVNGVAYKKIIAAPGCAAILNEGSFRLLREDTLEKKVYRLLSNGEEEKTLYDFNLMPGDTFVIREDTNNFIVLDSIINHIVNPFDCGIDGTPMLFIENPKVFYFNGASYPIIWVEGIGSLTGLLTSYEWGGGILGHTILCHYNQFRERDFHYIYCEEQDVCEGIVGDIEEVTNYNYFTIFPNPIKNEFTIDLKKLDYFNHIDMTIYNLNGQRQSSLTHKYGDNIIYNVENLENGIYFIKLLIDNQQIYFQKVIKQ